MRVGHVTRWEGRTTRTGVTAVVPGDLAEVWWRPMAYGTAVLNGTGELTGSMTLPLDETDYTYPVIDIKTFLTWVPSQDSNLSRIRPYPYYYTPFWHPYWGPYGRFPYYW